MSKPMTNLRCTIAICSAVSATLLTGCMVGPKYHTPPAVAQAPPVAYKEAPPPTQTQNTSGWTVAQPGDAMLRGKWWEIYNDPELNALEERLNIDNQNIKQFFANFMEARNFDCAGAFAALSDGLSWAVVSAFKELGQPGNIERRQCRTAEFGRVTAS